MTTYSLRDILLSFADKKGNKRILFNPGALGGINVNLIKISLLLLPFIEYALIFNPVVFNYLGIATAIVFFIVFLSIVMLIVFFVTWGVKKRVIKKITPSWNHYFKGKDILAVLSSGVTPYSDFFQHYAEILTQNLSEDEMYKALLNAFIVMEEENKDLISAMNRNNKLENRH
ncbi:MAG: type III secretory pathway component EscR [Sulfurimonas sp.]|jgi:type III secretory pathway component EscR|uniref:hypothetical protein n=1 Tax=Sulfurimonas sp. TaxID=2022749 RepID=UPI0039E43607